MSSWPDRDRLDGVSPRAVTRGARSSLSHGQNDMSDPSRVSPTYSSLVQSSRHHHSPSASAGKRETAVKEKAKSTSPITDLDERIRSAEAAIHQTTLRRSRLHNDHQLSGDTTLRQDSHIREQVSPVAETSATLRRSATLSSASARTPTLEDGYLRDVIVGMNDDEREKSGSSGGSGRRKPIPLESTHGAIVCAGPSARTAY